MSAYKTGDEWDILHEDERIIGEQFDKLMSELLLKDL